MTETNLPFEMPNFGAPADDYKPEAFDPDDVWIKGFQVGTTQIRILPCTDVNEEGEEVTGAKAWPSEREHYDEVVYAFPCSEKYGIECPGCKSSDPKVKERNRKYYVCALDKDGEQRIFKIGQGLKDTFLSRQQRMIGENPDNLQPLSDRDYHVTREGTTLKGTKYDADSGQEYPVDFPEPYDVKAMLKKAFARAWVHFNAVPVEKVAPPIPAGANFGQSNGRIPSKTAAAVQDTPPPAAAAASGDDDEDVLGRKPSIEELEDATSGALKAFLKRPEVGIEFPTRAARSRLLDLAKDFVAAEPPY